ncbi:hypothetical protein CapIbe_004368 [Capra ibex]
MDEVLPKFLARELALRNGLCYCSHDPANPPAILRLCGGWELGATIAGLLQGGGSPQAAKEADAMRNF